MTVPIMAEPESTHRSPLWRAAKVFGLSLAMVFVLGVAFGFVVKRVADGSAFSAASLALLGGFLLIAAGVAWLLVRAIRAGGQSEPLTAKERLNRNLLIACGLLGFGASILVMLGQSVGAIGPLEIISDAPLPAWIAIVMVVMIGVVIPVIALWWHRSAIDEQEADAYKTGALWGLYLFMTLAPAWWFAWRGGFAPPVDGVAIYVATVALVGVVWLWKKYR